MSEDLIKREDAIKAVAKYISCDYPTISMAEEDAKDLINTIPSADRPQGEWIALSGMQPPELQGKHYCSNCGHIPHLALNGGVYNYCPNCGAKMKGADDE